MRGNNLKIDINKDFLKEYKNDFYKGFSVTDIVHILAGLSVSAVVMLITVMLFHIDVVFAVYVSVPFAAPLILAGIYKYQVYLSPRNTFGKDSTHRVFQEYIMRQMSLIRHVILLCITVVHKNSGVLMILQKY